MKARCNNIKNEIAYFSKIVKNMDAKGKSKNINIENYGVLTHEINVLISSIQYNYNFNFRDLRGLIENKELYNAKIKLMKEQILLS